jgi:hypothetical protein
MAATRNEIKGWLERFKKEEATHVAIVCDTYDWDDFPKDFTFSVDTPKAEIERIIRADCSGNMQRLMEVYRLDLDLNTQLNKHRCFEF